MTVPIAIITGGSRGIGKEIARHFLSVKWHVLSLSRHSPELVGCEHISVDLSVPGWERALEKTLIPLLQGSGQICLIHSAGICPSDSIQTLSGDVLRTVMELNVVAPAILSHLLVPHMQRGSSIIYIGSTLSELAVPNTASYVTSKHAVAGLMKATCQDLENTGIHTCCICPGLTDTTMLHERINHNPEILAVLKNLSSYKRLVQPQEIAELVLFCAKNPVINGAVLHANLGQIHR